MTSANVALTKSVDVYVWAVCMSSGLAKVNKAINAATAVTASVSSAPATLTKNMSVAAQAVASTSSSAEITKFMACVGEASAQTHAQAAIDKTLGGLAGVALLEVFSAIELRNVLQGSALASAQGQANIILDKPLSGAGDGITQLQGVPDIKIEMEGSGYSFSATDSMLHITKTAFGYNVAVATVVNSKLVKLFTWDGITAGVAVDKVSAGVSVEGRVAVAATLETVQMRRVA